MRCTAELVAKLPSHEVYVAVLDNEKEVDSEREGSTWESYDTLIDDGTDEGSSTQVPGSPSSHSAKGEGDQHLSAIPQTIQQASHLCRGIAYIPLSRK